MTTRLDCSQGGELSHTIRVTGVSASAIGAVAVLLYIVSRVYRYLATSGLELACTKARQRTFGTKMMYMMSEFVSHGDTQVFFRLEPKGAHGPWRRYDVEGAH